MPGIGLGGAVFVAKYISRREKLQMKVSLLGQKPLISSSSIFNFWILNTHRGDSGREYVVLFYPVFRINQLARLIIIMIFSFQSRPDWKVFVDKFVFIVRFYVSIIYIKRVEGDHLDVTRQMRGYKKYKL